MIILAFFLGCGEKPEQLSEEETARYLKAGDEISSAAQKELLSNVAAEIGRTGPEGAVEYCNTRAIPLTDSIAGLYSAEISRLTDKNRNPDNALREDMDLHAWEQIRDMMKDTTIAEKHLVFREDDEMFYYKAIPLGMPTCLVCHGHKDTDITAATQKVLHEKYPFDKAFGYELGDLRGVWKITMRAEK